MPNLLSTIKLMREMEAAQDLSWPFPSDHDEWRCTSLNALLVVVSPIHPPDFIYQREYWHPSGCDPPKNTNNLLFLLFFFVLIHISVMCFRCRLFYLFLFMCFQIFPKKKKFSAARRFYFTLYINLSSLLGCFTYANTLVSVLKEAF